MKMLSRICIIPKPSGVGGMVTFRAKMTAALQAWGIDVCEDLADTPYKAVLVIGGTRNLGGLRAARDRGIPVVQRLDGINWLHRRRWTGLRHFLRSEYGNWLLSLIRARLATRIVYQSDFSRRWWEKEYKMTPCPSHVVYNGVDLAVFHPMKNNSLSNECIRLLLIEGRLGGGYELGIEHAIKVAENLQQRSYSRVEVVVVGYARPSLQTFWNKKTTISLNWTGLIPADQVPRLCHSAHLLYSADLNPACPNTVIEAMACGLPILAFDTGALPELVRDDAGRIVPYGGDPWRLQTPDFVGCAEAGIEILSNRDHFGKSARARAEAAFGLDHMVEEYLNVLSM